MSQNAEEITTMSSNFHLWRRPFQVIDTCIMKCQRDEEKLHLPVRKS